MPKYAEGKCPIFDDGEFLDAYDIMETLSLRQLIACAYLLAYKFLVGLLYIGLLTTQKSVLSTSVFRGRLKAFLFTVFRHSFA